MKLLWVSLVLCCVTCVACTECVDNECFEKLAYGSAKTSSPRCDYSHSQLGYAIQVTRSTDFSSSKPIICNDTNAGRYPGSPALQSFSMAVDKKTNNILLVGGRCKGAHNAVDRCGGVSTYHFS
jgi:hypothetical protein